MNIIHLLKHIYGKHTVTDTSLLPIQNKSEGSDKIKIKQTAHF